MHRRAITVASLTAVLALGGTGVTALAQDDAQEGPVTETAAGAFNGTIVTMEDEAGRTVYYLDLDGTLVELRFGPAWFLDLAALFGLADGDEVEIGGHLRDGVPNENASDVAKERAARDPVLRIKSVGGETRPKGKPAWAGGPKVQGEAHPGYEGWSKGQDKKAEKAPDAGKPDR
jgi:hypothetical protein